MSEIDFDAYIALCDGAVDAFYAVGRQFAVGPIGGSIGATDEARLRAQFGDEKLERTGTPGFHGGVYVDVMCRHVASLAALWRQHQWAVTPWTIVRAQLETAGRVGWLLEPGLTPDQRLARLVMEEVFSSGIALQAAKTAWSEIGA